MNAYISNGVTLVAALAITACSQGSSTPSGNPLASSVTGTPDVSGQPIAPVKAGNACDRALLTPADMTGILAEPITGTKPLKDDAQTCYFITATTEKQGGPKIRISLRPGHGRTALATFTSGQMDKYAKSVPLSGVGDGAVWLPGTYQVEAQKNDLLCIAGLGGSAVIGPKPDDLPKKLGALCNKLFSTY